MSAAPKLYLVDAKCPKCGAPARLAVTNRQIEKWKAEDPAELVQTYQCAFERGRKQCGAIFGISARAVQQARSATERVGKIRG